MLVDQELLDLLSRLPAEPGGDPTNGGDRLTDAELADIGTRITEVLSDIDRANPTEDDVRVATDAAAVLRQVNAETEHRNGEAASRAADLATALEGLEIPEPPAVETPAPEVDAVDDTAADDTAAEGAEPPDGGEPVDATAAVPVAAAARLSMPSLRNISARVPKRNKPVATATEAIARPRLLTASGSGATGLVTGDEIDLERWAIGVQRRYDAVAAMSASAKSDPEPIYLGQVRYLEQYGDDENAPRRLGDNRAANEAKLRSLTDPTSLAASGGICGPVAVDYSVTTIASADRPVRQAMAMFGAGRGGIRFILPHTLAAVTADGPAALWTQATDASPGNSTKAHATFVCQSPSEVYVDAVTSIVQFGNFQSRYFPEQVAQYLETVDAVHARLAEATLLAAMTTGSTVINAGNNGTANTGAATEYFAEMFRIAAAYRYRHRMPENATLQLLYPDYLEDMFRADIARELPGSNTLDERLAIADARIEGWLRAANLAPTSYVDNPTGATVTQGFGVQNAGDALPWPTKALSFLFHPGAWGLHAGGAHNHGQVRDSTLNRTNDFQMFSETFEKAVFRGHESLAIYTDLCPDGARAATVDTTGLCATGS